MDSRTLNRLMKRPHEMARYQMTGQLPRQRTRSPDSSLIRLLESIPVQERLHYRGIQLSPDLGYQCGFMFKNAQVLLQWLKPDQPLHEGETCPSESRQIRHFAHELTRDDLRAASSSAP